MTLYKHSSENNLVISFSAKIGRYFIRKRAIKILIVLK